MIGSVNIPRARAAGARRCWPVCLTLAGGLAGPVTTAAAQDSVAPAPGLPGDAVDAYRTAPPSEQINDYVVDLVDLTGSWGGRYAIGPIAKASRSTAPGTFNHLVGAQAAANVFATGPVARPLYALWNAPGQGVAGDVNLTPASSVSGVV